MKNLKILVLAAAAGLALLSGCGHKKTKVVVIISGGYYGYYSGTIFCDFTNNYCGSGDTYGISDNGCYYGNAYVCGTGNGTGYGTGNGTGNGSGYGTGNGSGGATGNGSGNGSGYGTGNGSGNGSGYGTGNGSGSATGNGSGYGTGNGSGNSSGSGSGNSSGSGSGNSSGNGSGNWTGSAAGQSGSGQAIGYSIGGKTKDVDLEQAQLILQDLDNRSQAFADQYGMSFESARQVTQLADTMQRITAESGMSDEDRDALANAALNVAGLSGDDVTSAYAKATQTGNQTEINALLEKGAKNLGMPSSAGLRDQILPSLGINLGK